MPEKDQELRALLRQWPDIEPRPAFVGDTLRRVRLSTAGDADAVTDAGAWGANLMWLRALWRLLATTAACAFAVGLLAGLSPMSRNPRHLLPASVRDSQFGLLRPGSVAGNYVAYSAAGRVP